VTKRRLAGRLVPPGQGRVSSVYEIAEKLGRLNEYDTFCPSLSYSVHGTIRFLIFEPGQVGVEPIRDFEGLPLQVSGAEWL
jgi:hypothetical protein